MPQSLAKLHMHLIFSTKNRVPVLAESISDRLHSYLGGTLNGLRCFPVEIGSADDHVHLLFDMARTISPAKVVEEVKKESSKWIKTLGSEFSTFTWQAGYGMFAVSASNVEAVRAYIRKQREHHRTVTFKEEFVVFLVKHGIEYDERYVWE
jgi:putative transposase